MEDSTLVAVAEYWQRFQAEQACSFLEQNGVPAMIWTDDAGGLGPSMGFVNGYQLRVKQDQANLAEELLSDFGLDRRNM
jgi:hypothetical protein